MAKRPSRPLRPIERVDRRLLAVFVATLIGFGFAVLAVRASEADLKETFTGADGTFVSQSDFWSSTDLGASKNSVWMSESGELLRHGNAGVSTNTLFRMWTRRNDFPYVKAEMDITYRGFHSGTEGWHGINLWLNESFCAPVTSSPMCSKVNDGNGPSGYAVDFMNRNGELTILKKVRGDTRTKWPAGNIGYSAGGTYYSLARTRWMPTAGRTYRFAGQTIDNGNGTTTIRIIIDGQIKLQVTDNASIGGPRLTGTRVGLRSDYANYTVDNLTITKQGATTPPPPPPPPPSTDPVTSFEAETMALAPAAGAVRSDPAASGGSYLNVWGKGTATKTVTTRAATGFSIRVRGDQCEGAPMMAVKIDGEQLGSVAVPSSSWVSQAFPKSLAAGSHTLEIGFENNYQTTACDRNLKLDRIDFTSAAATPPAPPVGPGDLNGDGVVNITDLSILLSKWGSADKNSDLNADGTVGIADLSILLSKWK